MNVPENTAYIKKSVFSGMQIMEKYVVTSLEVHLFFMRIMKEHALFLQASFPTKETNFRRMSDWYRDQFEMLLMRVVRLADGRVGECVLDSGEVVTEYTHTAEGQTSRLTGIPIRMNITRAEEQLRAGCEENPGRGVVQQVRNINQKAITLLNGLIELKERILTEVDNCRLYTSNYPLLIEHILREARRYRQTIIDIEENECIPDQDETDREIFWNQIMMEHAAFIRGLLDPMECELINTADDYVKEFACLLEMARKQDCRVQEELTKKTQEKTEGIRDFKAAGTKGLIECDIRSIILPLLADHVLREANHYLRLLKEE